MRTRLLVCADSSPYPPDRGDRVRYRHFLESLHRHFDVRLILVRRRSEALERPIDAVDVTLSRADILWGIARGLLSAAPVQFSAFDRLQARRAVGENARDVQAFVALGARAALFRASLHQDLPCVLDMQDSLAINAAAQWRAAEGLIRRIYALDNLLKAGRYERKLGRIYDVVTVAGPTDRDRLRSAHGVDARIIPTPVEAPPELEPLPDEPVAVFVGDLRFAPNIDAVHYLLNELWPRVLKRVPSARLVVVGHAPGPRLRRVLEAHECTTAFSVPATGPYVQAARVVVVPMRIGSGIKVKALEAMAAGRPVAMTALANEGIGAVAGSDAVVSDDPDALAEGIAELMGSRELADAMAGSGRSLVARRYSPAVVEQQLLAAVEAALARRRGDRTDD